MRKFLFCLAVLAGSLSASSALADERHVFLGRFSSCFGPLTASAMSADGDQIAYAISHKAVTRYYKLSVVDPGASSDSAFSFTFPDQSVRLNRRAADQYSVTIGRDTCRLVVEKLSAELAPEHTNAVATMVAAFIAEAAEEAQEEERTKARPSRAMIKAFLAALYGEDDAEESTYDDYNSILDALNGGKSSGEPATVIGGSNNPWNASSGSYGLPSPGKKQQSWHQNEDGTWVTEQGYTQEEMAMWDSNKDGWIDSWEYYVFSPFATQDAMDSIGNWFAPHGIWGWFR